MKGTELVPYESNRIAATDDREAARLATEWATSVGPTTERTWLQVMLDGRSVHSQELDRPVNLPPANSNAMFAATGAFARSAFDISATPGTDSTRTPLPLRAANEQMSSEPTVPGDASSVAPQEKPIIRGTLNVVENSDTLSAEGAVESRRVVLNKSVRTNRIAIVLSVALLVVLVDEKLASLREDRPNARAAQDARDEAIAHYERLKQDLEALRDVAVQLEHEKAEEKAVEKAATTFVQGRSKLVGGRARENLRQGLRCSHLHVVRWALFTSWCRWGDCSGSIGCLGRRQDGRGGPQSPSEKTAIKRLRGPPVFNPCAPRRADLAASR
jgi:hypothetical protein